MTEDFSLNWGSPPDPNARPPPGAHYGLEAPLLLPLDHVIPMRGHKLTNLASGTEPGDSVSLRQIRALLPKTATGTIERNSHGLAIVHKGAGCTPLALLIRPPGRSAYNQEPFVQLGNYVLYSARNALLDGAPYRFTFVGPDCEPVTREERGRSELALAAT